MLAFAGTANATVFTASGANVPINITEGVNTGSPVASSPSPSVINVTGLGTVSSLTVQITGFHEWNQKDVDVYLMAPNGNAAMLFSDQGIRNTSGVDPGTVDLNFDDRASAPLPLPGTGNSGAAGPALVTGNYQAADNDAVNRDQNNCTVGDPAGPPLTPVTLDTLFSTGVVNGDWKLFVSDDCARQPNNSPANQIAGWSLRFNEDLPRFPPVAAITLSGAGVSGPTDTTVRPGLTFNADSASTGSITDYAWDTDGDGQYDDATGPTTPLVFTDHTPPCGVCGQPQPDIVTIGLKVTDSVTGLSSTATQSISIAGIDLTLTANGNPSQIAVGASQQFNGTINDIDTCCGSNGAQWKFDFNGDMDFADAGDTGGTLSSFNTSWSASTSFATVGSHLVGERFTTADGYVKTISKYFNVGGLAPTVSDITTNPTAVTVGVPVTLSATKADQPGRAADHYEWDLDNDGQYDDSTDVNPVWTPPATRPGTNSNWDIRRRTICVRYFDNAGFVGQYCEDVIPKNRPTADFTPTSAAIGQPTTFNGTAVAGASGGNTVFSYSWDLDGNGTFEASGANPSKTYTAADAPSKDVTLRVTDGDGIQSLPVTKTVQIKAGPTVATSINSPNNLSPCTATSCTEPQNTTLTLDASSSTPAPGTTIASVSWDLDNSTSTGPNGGFETSGTSTTTTFPTTGSKTVRVRVLSDDGVAIIASRTISIVAPPVAGTIVANPAVAGSQLGTNQANTLTTSGSSAGSGFINATQWDTNNNGIFAEPGIDIPASGTTTGNWNPSTAGTFTIGMRVVTSNNLVASTTKSVTVLQSPITDFTIAPNPIGVGQQATLTATTTPAPGTTIASTQWDASPTGNANGTYNTAGTDPVAGSPTTFTWTSAGSRTVGMRVTDSQGVIVQVTKSATVANAPTANFTVNPSPAFTNEPITLTDTSTPGTSQTIPTGNKLWDLDGDGNYGEPEDGPAGNTASVTFTTPGTYTLGLKVTNNPGGLSSTKTTTVVVRTAPTPSFTFTPANPATGATIHLDAAASSDDGTIASYEWDTDGDGTYAEPSEDAPSGVTADISFASAGSHTVGLRVTDNDGIARTTTQSIPVHAALPPVADFTVSPAVPKSNETITLTSTSTDPAFPVGDLTYGWELDGDDDFNDATTASTTVSFAALGDHEVKLRVTNPDLQSDTEAKTITVKAPPQAGFTFLPASPLENVDTVNFTSTATDDEDGALAAANTEWDFDYDGTTFTPDATGLTTSHLYATAGTYTVAQRVTDSDGFTDIETQPITVRAGQAPTADFDYTPQNPGPNESITFDSTSTDDGSIATTEWDWDYDGTTFAADDSGDPATHSFSAAGPHEVAIRVTDDDGLSSVTSKTVTVNAAPTADFHFAPASPIENQNVTFTSDSSDEGSIASTEWDFDYDGTTFVPDATTGTPATHAFATAGTYTVAIRVTDNGGASSIATHDVTVDAAVNPTAAFTYNPATPLVGDTIDLDGTGSSDSDGSVVAYDWDLDDDGFFDDAHTATTSVPAAAAGNLVIKLQVTDDDGLTDVDTQTIDVNAEPTASFTFSPSVPVAGDPVDFDSTSTDPDGSAASLTAEWDWDYDGTTFAGDDTGDPASHTFASAGTYEVALKVTDADGLTDITSQTVTVVAGATPPVADFTFDPTNPAEGQTITLTDASSGVDDNIALVEWDTDGDGVFSEAGQDAPDGPTTTVTYPTGGNKTVSNKVTDEQGLTDTQTKTITVLFKPVANFTIAYSPVDATHPRTSDTITFTNTSTDADGSGVTTAEWDFDYDGSNFTVDATGDSVTNSYATGGTKTIAVRVTDGDNLTAMTTKTVVVHAPPVAAFHYTPAVPTTTSTITLTSDATNPDGPAITAGNTQWDYDYNGTFTSEKTGLTTTFPAGVRGDHVVAQRVIDNEGIQSAVTTQTIHVVGPPLASYTVSPNPAMVTEDTVTFTDTSTAQDGTISNREWDLDGDNVYNEADDAPAGTVSPTKVYATAGTFNTHLRVTDSNGQTAIATVPVEVRSRPTANFKIVPAKPQPGENVTFTQTGTDVDGTIASARWDFDDNGTFETTGTIVVHSFAAAGTYPVTVEVTDDDGLTSEVTKDVVVNAPPVADFTFTPTAAKVGQPVTLTSTSTDASPGTITSTAWDLDGDHDYDDATGASTPVTFATAGTHTVGVKVTDNDGASATATHDIVVTADPVASFTISPAQPKTGEDVSFHSTSSDADGTIADADIKWDLDNDGSFDEATGPDATEAFDDFGPHTVGLQVTDDAGNSTSTTQTFTVYAAPVVTIDAAPGASAAPNATITLTANATDADGTIADADIKWDLDGDGTFAEATGASTPVSFADPGDHEVGVQVTDSDGLQAVATKTIHIFTGPVPSFDFSPANPAARQDVTLTSTSTADAGIAAIDWDLDNDGDFDDAHGATAHVSFDTEGDKTVGIKVTDTTGASSDVTQTITVGPGVVAPVAAFTWSPATVAPNTTVTFLSSSTDADGTVATEEWDLDNDGQFDDAEGPSASRLFTAEGTYKVSLHVVDNDGNENTVSRDINVAVPAPGPQSRVKIPKKCTKKKRKKHKKKCKKRDKGIKQLKAAAGL